MRGGRRALERHALRQNVLVIASNPRTGDGRLVAGRRYQRASKVTFAQLTQRVVVRGVVIDARVQVRQVAAHEVQLKVVARAGAACRAEFDPFAVTPGQAALTGRAL